MSPKRREVVIAPSAVVHMLSFKPTPEELQALKTMCADLGADPGLGFKIAFLDPPLYRADVGRFRIHYSITTAQIAVSFIGMY